MLFLNRTKSISVISHAKKKSPALNTWPDFSREKLRENQKKLSNIKAAYQKQTLKLSGC